MACRALDQGVDERVVDRLLDQEPRAGGADLARVQEDRGQRVVEGDLEIGVGEDDVGVLSAELQRDLLHRRRRRGHDSSPGEEAARERHEVDPRVLGQQGPRLRAGAQHEVADSGGETRFREDPHQVDARVRSELAGLEDEGVASGQARRDLPARLEQRVVPRGDQAADADRLVDHPAPDVGVARVDRPPGVLGGGPAVVTEHRDDVRDVVLALDQTFAGVPGLRLGHQVRVALEQIGAAEEQVATLASRGVRPGSLVEGLVRRGDGGRGVVGTRLVDLGDDRPVSRANDRASPAGERAHPRSVDVEIWHPVVPPATHTPLRPAQLIAASATVALPDNGATLLARQGSTACRDPSVPLAVTRPG